MKENCTEPDAPNGGLIPEDAMDGAAGEEAYPADDGFDEEALAEQEQYDYTPEATDGEYIPDVSSPYIAAENQGFTSEWLGEDQYDEEEDVQ